MADKQAILVIGAGDATGGAIAKRFAREGYIARATRSTVDKLQPWSTRIRAEGGEANGFGSDARKEDDMISLPWMETFRGPDAPTEDFQLRFRSLFSDGEAFVFPCNASGHVLMDALSERARSSYLFARATVGRLYAPPQVIATTQCELEPA